MSDPVRIEVHKLAFPELYLIKVATGRSLLAELLRDGPLALDEVMVAGLIWLAQIREDPSRQLTFDQVFTTLTIDDLDGVEIILSEPEV